MIPVGAFAKGAEGGVINPNPPELEITPATVTISATAATVIDLSGFVSEVGSTNGLTLTAVAQATKGSVAIEAADALTVRYTPPSAGLVDDEVVTFRATVRIKTTLITGVMPVTATAQVTGSTGFTHRHRVVISPQPAQLTDFVACVRLSDPLLRTTANGGAMRSATGADVKVESESGQNLPFVIDEYAPASGALILYVRVGTVLAGTPFPIVVKWGQDSAPGYQNTAATWAGWLARWHLPSGADRTGNGRNLTVASAPSIGGMVGIAGDFAAGSDVQLANIDWLNGLSAITVVGLVRNDLALPIDRGFLSVGSPSGEDPSAPLMIRYMGAGDPGLGGARSNVVKARLATSDSGSGAIESKADQARTGVWSQVALAWSSGNAARINVNGVEQLAGAAKTFTGVTAFGGGPLYVGRSPTGQAGNADRWDGGIDEIGIVASALPAAQLSAMWDAIRDGGARMFGKSNAEVISSSNGPVALPKAVTVREDGAIDIGLGGLTYRPPGMPGPLTHSITAGPSHGTATLAGSVVTYRPTADYFGPDEFTFRASAGGKTSSAKVYITVTDVTEPPPPPDPSDPDPPGDEGEVGYYPPIPTFTGTTYYVAPGRPPTLSTNRNSPGAAQYALRNAPSNSTIVFLQGSYGSLDIGDRGGVNLYLKAERPVFQSIDTARRTSISFASLPGEVVKGLLPESERTELRGLGSTDFGDLVVEGFYGRGRGNPNTGGKFNLKGRGRVWYVRNYIRDTDNEALQVLRKSGTNPDNRCRVAVWLQNWVHGENYTSCNPTSPYWARPGNPSGTVAGCNTPQTPTHRAWTDYGIYIDGIRKVYVVKNLMYGIMNHLMSVKRFCDDVYVDQNLFVWPNDADPKLHASAQVGQEQDYDRLRRFNADGTPIDSTTLLNQDQTIGKAFVRYNTFHGAASTAFWVGNVNYYEATDNYLINVNYVMKSHVDGSGWYRPIGPRHPEKVLLKNNRILSSSAKIECWPKGVPYKVTLDNNTTPNDTNPVITRVRPFETDNYPSNVERQRPEVDRVGGSASGFGPVQNL